MMASFGARVSLWLIGLMWVLPFMVGYHRVPITSFYSEWLAAILGLAALTLFVQRRYWQTMEMPRIAFVPLGLVGLLLVQLAATDKIAFPSQAFMAALYLLWAVFLMLLGGALRREIGWAGIVTTLARFTLIGGLTSAVIGILQYYQVHSVLDSVIATRSGDGSVFANIGQTNQFANYTGLAIASLLFLLASRQWPRMLLLGMLPVLLFALALSGSRSSWLYLGALAVLALGFYWRTRDAEHRILVVVALLLLPGFALVQAVAQLPWLVAQVPPILVNERLFETASGINVRLVLWQEAWQMFLQDPWLGVGFGQFSWHHFQLAALSPTWSYAGLFNQAHNLVMHLLAEMGSPAVLLLITGVGLWLSAFVRQEMTLSHWWVLALLSILGIHSMLEYPLWYFNFLGIAAILLGAGEARTFRLDLQKTGRFAFILILVLGWMSAGNLAYSYRSLEGLLFTRYHDAPKEREAESLLQDLQQIHQETLLTPYIELAYTGAIELSRDNLADKLELNGRVMRFAPTSPVVYRHALLLALNGEQDSASQQWVRAAASYPDNLERNRGVLLKLAARDSPTYGPLIRFVESNRKE